MRCTSTRFTDRSKGLPTTMRSCVAASLACFAVASSFAFVPFALSQSQGAQDKLVHLNQIQVIGTHNSYNTGFAPSEAKYLKAHNPDAYAKPEYSHPPLPAPF